MKLLSENQCITIEGCEKMAKVMSQAIEGVVKKVSVGESGTKDASYKPLRTDRRAMNIENYMKTGDG